jgi:hypothetical protein
MGSLVMCQTHRWLWCLVLNIKKEGVVGEINILDLQKQIKALEERVINLEKEPKTKTVYRSGSLYYQSAGTSPGGV